MKKTVLVCVLCFCTLAYCTDYSSSDLGWADGSNIDAELADFLNNTAVEGDSLHLEGMYKITTYDNHFPDNFTLTAVKGGGFDCAGSSSDGVGGYYLVAGSGMTLDNCTFMSSSAPVTDFNGNNPVRGTDFHNGTVLNGSAGNVTIRWCSFTANLGSHLRIAGKFTIRNSHFHRAAYQIYMVSGSNDVYLYQSVWDDALIDGIKTVSGSKRNINWLVEDCVFQRGRDGIDVTGGLQDTEIRDTIFRQLNVTAFDAKILLENLGGNFSNDIPATKNVVFNDCEFIDISNCIVTSLLNKQDETISFAEQEYLAPQHIVTNRCVYERTPQRDGDVRMYLIKMGHNIIWNNAIQRGTVLEKRILNATAQDGWECHDYYGTIDEVLPGRNSNLDIDFEYGPRDSSVDSDNDGMDDEWENENSVDDPDGDPDGDDLTNLEEFQNDTDPNNSDSDGDGLDDGWEIENDLDPLVDDSDDDPDGDGLTNLEEYNGDTDPNSYTDPDPEPDSETQDDTETSGEFGCSSRSRRNASPEGLLLFLGCILLISLTRNKSGIEDLN